MILVCDFIIEIIVDILSCRVYNGCIKFLILMIGGLLC